MITFTQIQPSNAKKFKIYPFLYDACLDGWAKYNQGFFYYMTFINLPNFHCRVITGYTCINCLDRINALLGARKCLFHGGLFLSFLSFIVVTRFSLLSFF